MTPKHDHDNFIATAILGIIVVVASLIIGLVLETDAYSAELRTPPPDPAPAYYPAKQTITAVHRWEVWNWKPVVVFDWHAKVTRVRGHRVIVRVAYRTTTKNEANIVQLDIFDCYEARRVTRNRVWYGPPMRGWVRIDRRGGLVCNVAYDPHLMEGKR